MPNPWEELPLPIYEAHMEEAGQLALLNRITRAQLTAFPVKTAAIWGVAGGNGLEHMKDTSLAQLWGIDVNQAYLDLCSRRYPELAGRLILLCRNLADPLAELPRTELILANLLAEYIGVETFCRQAERCALRYVSCVIQQNGCARFVSPSPFQEAFSGISSLHADIASKTLQAGMEQTGFRLLYREDFPLSGGKSLIRLDFQKNGKS